MLKAFISILLLTAPAFARELASLSVSVDSLLAKVGQEAVLLSDLQRFAHVSEVLSCAGVLKNPRDLPAGRRDLLNTYIEDELLFLEAKSRKFSTDGNVPRAVRSIHDKADCHEKWQRLGKKYSAFWRTENRAREGESLLVRELEKQILIENFRKSEVVSDGDLWRREARTRYPVKILLE